MKDIYIYILYISQGSELRISNLDKLCKWVLENGDIERLKVSSITLVIKAWEADMKAKYVAKSFENWIQPCEKSRK